MPRPVISASDSARSTPSLEQQTASQEEQQGFQSLLLEAKLAARNRQLEVLQSLCSKLRIQVDRLEDPIPKMNGLCFLAGIAIGEKDFATGMKLFSDVVSVAKKHRSSGPAILALVGLGEKLQRVGYFNPALSFFREVSLNTMPDGRDSAIRATGKQITLLVEMEEVELAAQMLRKAKQDYAVHEHADLILAEATIHIAQGKANQVLALLGPDSVSPERQLVKSQLFYHWVLAKAFVAEGEYHLAREQLQFLQAEAGFDFGQDLVEVLQAEIAIGLGEHSGVRESLEEIVFRNENFAAAKRAGRLLVKLYESNEDYEAATKLLLTLEENYTEHIQKLVTLGASAESEHWSLRQELDETKEEISKYHLANQELAKQKFFAWRAFGLSVFSFLLVGGVIGFYVVLTQLRREKRLTDLEKKHNEALVQVVNETTEALNNEINERVELEKSLERTRRDEAIGKLTGNVAHDFNNLLQVIISTNEYLRSRDLPFSSVDSDLIATATKSAQIGASIVRQLLAYAKQQVLAPKAIAISEYFGGTADLLKAAVRRPCVLEIENRCGDIHLKIDSNQLTTSLINLLTNALDAMPEGGKIRLVARRFGELPSDREYWPGLNPEDHVTVEVIDQGKGLSEDEKSHVFEPFYTTKLASTGTGLGLSSVLGFVQQSGGDVAIFNNEKRGLRVTMVFPIATEVSAAELPKFESVQDVDGKVLVVEDNQFVAMSVKNDLAQLGYDALWVEGGREAIELFLDGFHFDAIVSDVRMPGDVSGIELRDWIRQNYPETAFVLMSGYSNIDSHPERSAFLQKPFTRIDLLHAINEELAMRRPSSRSRHSSSSQSLIM